VDRLIFFADYSKFIRSLGHAGRAKQALAAGSEGGKGENRIDFWCMVKFIYFNQLRWSYRKMGRFAQGGDCIYFIFRRILARS
jgi:hypothetical protein